MTYQLYLNGDSSPIRERISAFSDEHVEFIISQYYLPEILKENENLEKYIITYEIS